MTEEKPETPVADAAEAAANAAPETPKYFIEVRGQRVEITPSSPEQLAMMRITANRLARLNASTMTTDDILRAYQKVIQLVTSLPVSIDDRDWLEDLLMSKSMNLDEAGDILDKAAEEWASKGNREQRRATKSARRKPAAARK